MKQFIGFIIFLLAIGFLSGLLITLIWGAWYNLYSDKVIQGFFGFGIPTLITGLGAVSLWHEDEGLSNVFIISTIFFAVLFGIGLLSILINWIFIENSTSISGGYFIGFGPPMVFLCVVAILALEEDTSKKK